LVFKGDLRISISTEKNLGTPYQLSPTAELQQKRLKERWTYKF
jgi:hypothetical protein